jgi:type IV pilus assembly protein PilW
MKLIWQKHTSTGSTINPATGFTLIELMIGLALSTVVLGGLLAVYIPTIKSWNANAGLAHIHDTESLIHDIFGTSIRQAGLLACGKNSDIIDGVGISALRGETSLWALKPHEFLNTSFKAFAADKNVATDLGADVQNSRLKNKLTAGNTVIGDVFFVLAPSTGFYRVDAHNADSDNKTLTLSSRSSLDISFNAGQFFIVNDCKNPVLLRSSTDAQSTYSDNENKATILLNYTNQKLAAYRHPVNTVVNEFEPAIFYLRPKAGIPTLYKATISTSTPLKLIHTPILTGVENLRIEYGIADTNGDYIEKYESVSGSNGTGSSATDTLDNVLSIRISVMIQAPGSNSVHSNMSFPNLKGEIRFCFRDGESVKEGYEDACPNFLNTIAGSSKAHKVIQFTYILPRVTSI